MLRKLAVGLQAVCLCVVVSFFAAEIVGNNAKGIVGGWCGGGIITNPPCHSDSSQRCSGSRCSYTYSECNGGAGGSGMCVNAQSQGGTGYPVNCTETGACVCSKGS